MVKLPYIPNKKLYAAVMGACKWIREDGCFNKATSYYSDKYNVSVDDVRKYVRIAQGNGQKKANEKRPKRKYYWFAIEYAYWTLHDVGFCGIDYLRDHSQKYYAVKKGLSEDSVTRAMTKNERVFGDYDHYKQFLRIEKFDTEQHAQQKVNEWTNETGNYER